MQRTRLWLLGALALSACGAPRRPEPRIDPGARFGSASGCFLLYDVRAGKLLHEHNPEQCSRRLPACSTFKVPLAAIAFDAGVLKDETEAMSWDGARHPIESWNKDHTAATWMSDSVVWYSQRLTHRIGKQRLQAYLDRFEYGTRDLSGGLDRAWLTAASFLKDGAAPTLRISPREQLAFLRRLRAGELGLSPRALELTRKITFLEESPRGWRLSGKTGSGFTGSPDGPRIGWFIAHVEGHGEELLGVAAFTETERPQDAPAYGGRQAREIFEALLADSGRW